MPDPTLDDLRRHAVARSLFGPTTLAKALERFGFVQADPIRAPARAQDLTLRHRVAGYRAGDLERRYARLDVHEDFFVNYGFLTGRWWRLMHPRDRGMPWDAGMRRRAHAVLDYVHEHGVVHPREVEAHFEHGRTTNYWGGSSNATTKLLDNLHYRGLLRVVRRESGVRVYAPHAHEPRPRHASARREQVDALVDLVVDLYAPLPARTLTDLLYHMRGAVPQHRPELAAALARARGRFAQARIGSTVWYWLPEEDPREAAPDARVRLLAPFDPIVWDRRRFEAFWDWAYRFEAYTPPAKRTLGYYALPLLHGDRVVGWGNLAAEGDRLDARIGLRPGIRRRDAVLRRELEAELERMRRFLALESFDLRFLPA
jgi:uncharacterized protein YcaQ